MWWWIATAQALTLGYEDALARTLERNPALLQAGLDRESADGALLAARATFEPTLSANTGYSTYTSQSVREFGEVASEYRALNWGAGVGQTLATGTSFGVDYSTQQSSFRYELQDGSFTVEDDALFDTQLRAQLSQSLLQGHRMASNLSAVRRARQARDASEANLEVQRQQALADTANAYWNLAYQQRVVAISEQALAVAQEERRVVLARVEAGDLAPVERSRVEAAVVQAEAALLTARNAAQVAADGLLLLVGEAPGQEVVLITAPVDPVAVSIDEAQVVEGALQNNPAAQAMRIEETGAHDGLEDARHARLPELTARANYGVRGFEDSLSAATAEMASGALPEWGVAGDLSLPLGNRSDRGRVLQAQAQAERARIEREAFERSLVQQVRAQVRALEAAGQQVDLARANLGLAEETLAAERALSEAGRSLQKDVLEAMRAVDDARVQLEKARADYQLAIIELERLKGTL